tara:strand:- start:656 stop:823 length:168 start_codon:yes stop_codon:yes gene_type:complete
MIKVIRILILVPLCTIDIWNRVAFAIIEWDWAVLGNNATLWDKIINPTKTTKTKQ